MKNHRQERDVTDALLSSHGYIRTEYFVESEKRGTCALDGIFFSSKSASLLLQLARKAKTRARVIMGLGASVEREKDRLVMDGLGNGAVKISPELG